MGQQRAELKRTAPGKRFIGDTGAEEARQAERAKVTQMQAVARAAALRVEEETDEDADDAGRQQSEHGEVGIAAEEGERDQANKKQRISGKN